MTHKILFVSATLAITLLFGSQVRADFLGLAPGDYNIELLGSGSSCGGTNCVGAVHIPDDPVTTANFDWSFLNSFHDFLWDDINLIIAISPNGLNSCALESTDSTDSCTADNTGFGAGIEGEALFLGHQVSTTGVPTNLYVIQLRPGTWVATPAQVPEPSSLVLLGIGFVGVWSQIRRRRLRLNVTKRN